MPFILDSIALPTGLYWGDKYDWTPVSQRVSVSLTGSLIVEEAAQLAGRPITLVGGDRRCWCPRSLVDQLLALAQEAGRTMTLDLGADGVRTVIWRRDQNPIEAAPVVDYDTPTAGDLYIIRALRFLQTA